jgi:hypothetical protein
MEIKMVDAERKTTETKTNERANADLRMNRMIPLLRSSHRSHTITTQESYHHHTGVTPVTTTTTQENQRDDEQKHNDLALAIPDLNKATIDIVKKTAKYSSGKEQKTVDNNDTTSADRVFHLTIKEIKELREAFYPVDSTSDQTQNEVPLNQMTTLEREKLVVALNQ